jgi:2-keto-4-pentenoate hydratase/2-oxohepta-3-ene-1,7-dioic acid hydratase in catechol pathway
VIPIDRPEKIVCVGLNYEDHAAELGEPRPARPLLFAKWLNTLIGPGDPIVMPSISQAVDYEGELGVGARARCATAYFTPMTIESGPIRCSARVLLNPASIIQPLQSAAV